MTTNKNKKKRQQTQYQLHVFTYSPGSYYRCSLCCIKRHRTWFAHMQPERSNCIYTLMEMAGSKQFKVCHCTTLEFLELWLLHTPSQIWLKAIIDGMSTGQRTVNHLTCTAAIFIVLQLLSCDLIHTNHGNTDQQWHSSPVNSHWCAGRWASCPNVLIIQTFI